MQLPSNHQYQPQESGGLIILYLQYCRMNQNHAPTIDLTSGSLLLALATVWGGSFFFAEIALREVPPLTVALHRIFWAVPVLFLLSCGNAKNCPGQQRLGYAIW